MSLKIKKIKVNNWYLIPIIILLTILFPPNVLTRRIELLYKGIAGALLLFGGIHKNRNILEKIRPIILLSIAIPLSAIVNNRSINTILHSFLISLIYLDTFLIISKFLKKYKLPQLLSLIFRILTVYIIVNDISVMLIPARSGNIYFVGSKFGVSYMHLLWFSLLLFFSQEKKHILNKTIVVIGFIESFFVIMKAECSTGLLLLTFAFIMDISNKQKTIKKILNNRKTIPFAILLSVVLFFSLDFILSLHFVADFIVNVLGESMSLTGRTEIYQYVAAIIANKPWFGYGYETDIVSMTLGWGGNSQNGIMQLLLWYGVLGLIGFTFTVLLCCFKGKQYDGTELRPCIITALALILAAIIEISFNNYFYLCLAIIYCSSIIKTKDSVDVAKAGL